VYTWLDATVQVMVRDTGTSTADANLNVATGGNGAKLNSIVLA
jgi:hypothetical protein